MIDSEERSALGERRMSPVVERVLAFAGHLDLSENQELNLDVLAVETAWGFGWPGTPPDTAVCLRLKNRPHLVERTPG